MRVIITGNRHWYDPDLAEALINRLRRRYGPNLIIVHGAADGIDLSFAEACAKLGVKHEPHPARFDDLEAPGAVIRHKNGRPYNAKAGAARNAKMIAAGAGMCIAFHEYLAGSRGTNDCVRRAIEAGIPTYLVDSEAARPRRLWADDVQLQ
jgi:hypothetical protein